MELQRRRDESAFDHHKRLVYGKLVDKTLADADYTELAEHVYGKQYSSDVARRMLYGSRHTIELMESEGLSAEKSCSQNDIDSKILELQKERQRLSDQRREYSKLVSADGRFEHICDRIASAASNLTKFDGLFDDIVNLEFNANDAILVLSDWHYGMTANNIYNTYNTDVCVSRVETVVEKTIERIRLHKCENLHVVVLGDLINGGIHVSSRVASEELVADQIMNVSEILARAIYQLSSFVTSTSVYVTYGNHARTIANKKDSIHRDNLERIVPWFLEWRFQNCPDINVVDCDRNEFVSMNIRGHSFCATHGDLDTVRTAPSTLPTLMLKKYGVDLEYIILGDKHHQESMESTGVVAMLCGSLCGSDGYANERRLYSDPSQLLLIVNEQCGVDAEYRLKC